MLDNDELLSRYFQTCALYKRRHKPLDHLIGISPDLLMKWRLGVVELSQRDLKKVAKNLKQFDLAI